MFMEKRGWWLVGMLVCPLFWVGWLFSPREARTEMPALLFVENVGQFGEDVRFRVDTPEGVVWLMEDGLYGKGEMYEIPNEGVQGGRAVPVTLSYFQGKGVEDWYASVPVWEGVRYISVWPGVDLEIGSEGNRLVYRYVEGRGRVVLPVGDDVLAGLAIGGGEVTLGGGEGLTYGSFLGGVLSDEVYDVAVDVAGDLYVTGYTSSFTFPTFIESSAPQHGVDVFVAKFDMPAGTLDYAVHINPPSLNRVDIGHGIVVDCAGNAYVVGETNSPEFPITEDVYDSVFDETGGEAFVLKLSPDGKQLLFSTFLGGDDTDIARDVALDAGGNVVVAGGSWSSDFLTHTFGSTQQRNLFVAQLDAQGRMLQEGLLIGGDRQEEARGVAIDGQGLVYLAGWTLSDNLPVTSQAILTETVEGDPDAFLFQVDLATNSIGFGTYLGGTAEDRATGVVVDDAGNSYVTGLTRSIDFPTTSNAYQPVANGGDCGFEACTDAFVSKVLATGDALSYSTYLGGTNEDVGEAITLLGDYVAVTGGSWSADLPVTADAVGSSLLGERDGFVTVLDMVGGSPFYSSYMGGSDWEKGQALGVNRWGDLYVGGYTNSADLPVTANGYDVTLNGESDGFVWQLSLLAESGGLGQVCRQYMPAVLR